MASVYLKRRELGGGRLPRVCIVCGHRGHLTEVMLRCSYSFNLFSHGVTITTFLETALPLCGEHEDHFTRLNKYYVLGFAFLALLMLTAAACFFTFGLGAFAVFFLIFVGAALVLGVTHTVVTLSRTRAVWIEDRGVRMACVSDRFVDALEDLRDGVVRGVEEEDERPRRRRRDRGGVPAWVWAAGGGGLVLLLACGGVTAYLVAGGNSSGADPGVGNRSAQNGPGQGPVPGPGAGIAPALHNRRTQRVTQMTFRKLKAKMTVDEVRAILGPQDHGEIEAGGGGCLTWMEGRDTIQVFFRDGRLTMASCFVNGNVTSLFDMPGMPQMPHP